MKIASTISSMRSACDHLRHIPDNDSNRALIANSSRPRTLGLVPTMGALHAGHLSLLRASKRRCDITTASIFVNPTQFGPAEDLAQYPRTFEEDCRLLEAEGVDLLFAPDVVEIYPAGALTTFVEVAGIGDRLDGASRPGHFRGVATVVAKLLHIVTPDVAFFGKKDAAQVAVLRAMVRDLNFAVELAICPTIREADGVALSSRNRFLKPSERIQARALSTSLHAVSAAAASGVTDSELLRETLHQQLSRSAGVRIDYAEIVDPDTLEPVPNIANGALVAVAAWIGSTRLIDNTVLLPIASEPKENA